MCVVQVEAVPKKAASVLLAGWRDGVLASRT